MPNKYKVAVVGDDNLVVDMFKERNADVTVLGNPLKEAQNNHDYNLVVFTGGSDVSPWLYGEKNLASYTNENRDIREVLWYHRFLNTPKVGICRGGQFLFVMNGGKMEQHIEGHGASHQLKYEMWVPEGIGNSVTSTHHQHMAMTNGNQTILAKSRHDNVNEIIWSGYTQSLSFQPHPEYDDLVCRDIFFWHLKKLMKLNFLRAEVVRNNNDFLAQLAAANPVQVGVDARVRRPIAPVFGVDDLAEEVRNLRALAPPQPLQPAVGVEDEDNRN